MEKLLATPYFKGKESIHLRKKVIFLYHFEQWNVGCNRYNKIFVQICIYGYLFLNRCVLRFTNSSPNEMNFFHFRVEDESFEYFKS